MHLRYMQACFEITQKPIIKQYFRDAGKQEDAMKSYLRQAESLNPSHPDFKQKLKRTELDFLDEYCRGLRHSSRMCEIEKQFCEETSDRREWSKLILAICDRIEGAMEVEENLVADRFVFHLGKRSRR